MSYLVSLDGKAKKYKVDMTVENMFWGGGLLLYGRRGTEDKGKDRRVKTREQLIDIVLKDRNGTRPSEHRNQSKK